MAPKRKADVGDVKSAIKAPPKKRANPRVKAEQPLAGKDAVCFPPI